MQNAVESFGIDWEELPDEYTVEAVEVQETVCPCSDVDMALLRQNFDPAVCCDDYGISLYIGVRNFILETHV